MKKTHFQLLGIQQIHWLFMIFSWHPRKHGMKTTPFSRTITAFLPTLDLLHLQSSSLDCYLGNCLKPVNPLCLDNAEKGLPSTATLRWVQYAARREAWLEPGNCPASYHPRPPHGRPSRRETCPLPAKQNKTSKWICIPAKECKWTHRYNRKRRQIYMLIFHKCTWYQLFDCIHMCWISVLFPKHTCYICLLYAQEKEDEGSAVTPLIKIKKLIFSSNLWHPATYWTDLGKNGSWTKASRNSTNFRARGRKWNFHQKTIPVKGEQCQATGIGQRTHQHHLILSVCIPQLMSVYSLKICEI